MNAFTLITITPTEPELIWLRELLRRQQSHEALDPWATRIALRNKLPVDFAPSSVNPLLAGSNGITLLGVLMVDPDNKVIEDTERVVFAIRDRLISKPSVRNVTAAEIADELGLSIQYTEDLFGLMSTVGTFWVSATGSERGRGPLSSINVDREDCLTAFMAFRGIRAQIEQMLADREHAAARAADKRLQLVKEPASAGEIFQLKPSLYGISVDLNALWRRLRGYLRRNQS